VRKLYWQKLGVVMGENTYANLGMKVTTGGDGVLKIGANVSIAQNVTFVLCSDPNNGDEIKTIPYVRNNLIKNAGITVEDEVWLGANVTILPGCKIGRCSVIGAGSVVTENIDPYSVYAGVPAKKIRDLREGYSLSTDATI
jgi:maltose O-acetyltransferase